MQKGIIKNVNRITGEPIDAKDLASLFSGIIGEESGVLTVFDELRLEKISDNKVRLHSGVYSLKGHILYIPKGSYEDFEIESGTLGANRIDLLIAEFVKNGEGDGEDTLQFRIVKGESSSGSPQKPDLIQQDVNENGITRQEVLYELILNGVTLSIRNASNKLFALQSLKRDMDEGIDNIYRTFSLSSKEMSLVNGSSGSLKLYKFGKLRALQGSVSVRDSGNDITERLESSDRPEKPISFYGVSSVATRSVRVTEVGRIIAYGEGSYLISVFWFV